MDAKKIIDDVYNDMMEVMGDYNDNMKIAAAAYVKAYNKWQKLASEEKLLHCDAEMLDAVDQAEWLVKQLEQIVFNAAMGACGFEFIRGGYVKRE